MAKAREDRFEVLWGSTEARLRRALVAAYGSDVGEEAFADARAWAWEHLDRLEAMGNPSGYLWRVGQSSVRRTRRLERTSSRSVGSVDDTERPAFEPALRRALATLSPRQRAAALLIHGYGYSLTEAAEVMGCRVRTLRNHLDRAMRRLQDAVGVNDV